jgi:hypothetical protein
MQLTTIGHPYGWEFQTLPVSPTQDGFADSTSILSRAGRPLFTKSIDVIPLNLTIYNGMSGAPVLDSKGAAIALLSGSLNVGGSLAWAIPAKAIVDLSAASVGEPVEISKVKWKPLTAFSGEWRGFALPRDVSASETVAWLNSKWQDKGVVNVDAGGFVAHITNATLVYESAARRLDVRIQYSLTGDDYRTQYFVALEDAARATVSRKGVVTIECPRDRSCVRLRTEKLSGGVWKVFEEKTGPVAQLDVWRFVDSDSAGRAASAMNHLIALHGGPLNKAELFNK